MQNNPILVSGIHRSGSTWVGSVIAQSKNIKHVSEPFNVNVKDYSPPFEVWYKYVSNNVDPEQQQLIKNYLNKCIFFNGGFNADRFSSMPFMKKYKFFITKYLDKLLKRTVLKDPIALFSAEWIYDQYNCDVIILIRHPAAFYLSIKEKNWEFNFDNFMQQPLLIEGPLRAYKEKIEKINSKQIPIIEQAALIWNCIYTQVYDYQRKYLNNWYFIKHEDLSRNPLVEFEKMFEFLNLKFSFEIENYISNTTNSGEDLLLKRDTKSNILKWKKLLSYEEISFIKTETEHVWRLFYEEHDW